MIGTMAEAEVTDSIRGMLTGINKLHAVFVTYRTVDGYESGPVETGKPGLDIVVQSGIRRYSDAVHIPLLFSELLPDGEPSKEEIQRESFSQAQREAAQAQSVIDRRLRELTFPEGEQILAVVYAGLTAFEEALECARSFRELKPDSKVVLVTCDCDLDGKHLLVQPLIDNGVLDLVVVTPFCGGKHAMRDILDTIVASWPDVPSN